MGDFFKMRIGFLPEPFNESVTVGRRALFADDGKGFFFQGLDIHLPGR
jgi:hypothetical protein